jgi:hypothetical protein
MEFTEEATMIEDFGGRAEMMKNQGAVEGGAR